MARPRGEAEIRLVRDFGLVHPPFVTGEATGALARGVVLGGRYVVEEEVGSGAMGRVYRVVHDTLRLPLAVKILHPELAVIPEVRQRIEREARLSALLDHPSLVQVTDFGMHEHRPYLVMRLVDGEELASRMDRGSVPPREAIEIGLAICDGLAHAHGLGLVHRDLKPDNVVLTARGLRILDFGLARAIASDDPRLTRTGLVCGTPRYMSPEQASGDPIDARSDLYAVGVLLHEMLTGDALFDGATAQAVLKRQIVDSPPALNLPETPDVDVKALARAVDKALVKDAAKRFPDAKTMEAALRGCLRTPKPRSHRRRAALGLAAAVVLAAVALLGVVRDPLIEARAALGAGQLSTAESVLRERLTGHPKDAEARLLFGRVALARGRADSALKAWLSAFEADSSLMGQESLLDEVPRALEEGHGGDGAAKSRTARFVGLVSARAPIDGVPLLAEIARTGPSPSLRRRAYEGLERLGQTDALDVLSFLSGELESVGSARCPIRKWYVDRLAGLDDAKAQALVTQERSRRRSGCL